jgi:predicted DNA-binding transcriptional regulator AlpA
MKDVKRNRFPLIKQAELIKLIRETYSVSRETAVRWINAKAPKPHREVTRRSRYWLRSEIDAWFVSHQRGPMSSR